MSKLPSILLYLGPEDGLRAEELDSLRSRIRKESGGEAAEHRIYLPDGTVSDAVDLLENGSLFAKHRLVIVSGAEQIRRKADVETIASYGESPPDDATLVLVSDAVRLDAKLEKAVPPQSRKVFWELFDNQKRNWVVSHFRKRNVAITPDALELFLDLVENNTLELRTEADKLCVYVDAQASQESSHGRPTVDVDQVETFIYHSREENVFSLYKRIVDDDFPAALETVEKLDSSGEGGPVQLVGGLVFQVRKLVSLRSLLDNGVRHDEAFTKLGIRGKRIQADYRTAAERFDLAEVQRQLYVLIEYDTAFRELGSGLERTLMDMLVYQLMFPRTTFRLEEDTDARLVG
jgi:DNA polymerase III subunit delta